MKLLDLTQTGFEPCLRCSIKFYDQVNHKKLYLFHKKALVIKKQFSTILNLNLYKELITNVLNPKFNIQNSTLFLNH